MEFRKALPFLPGVAILLLIGAYLLAYLWVDDAAETHFLSPAAATQSDRAIRPDAELAPLQQIAPPVSDPEHSTAWAELQKTMQTLESSNKALSDQVGALAARLDDLEKARAEMREPLRRRPRRR